MMNAYNFRYINYVNTSDISLTYVLPS